MKRLARILISNIFSGALLFIIPAHLSAASVGSPNELGNPSFELPIGSGGADSGNWDNTNSAVRIDTTALNALSLGTSFPDGAFGVSVPSGTFTFQVVDGARPGNFVAFTGFARSTIPNGASQGGRMKIEFKEIKDGGDRLISTVSSDCIDSTNAAAFTRFTISGYAPGDTGRIVFTLDRCGGVGNVAFDQMSGTINGFPIELGVESAKNRLPKGGATFATINLANSSVTAQSNVELIVSVPNGLTLIEDGTRLNHSIPNAENVGDQKIFRVGNLGAQDDRNLSFLLTVSPGAAIGHRYDVTMFARGAGSDVHLSQTRHLPITVIADPLFDEGTILGKVFDDRNENGIQDKGEVGVPSVRLATEEGIVILTDKDGKYHIPGVQPGRHLIKIDGHSLPQGTKFITEESYLVKSTEGLISKVDFAVKLPDSKVPKTFQQDLAVVVSQGTDFKRPILNVALSSSVLRMGVGRLEKSAMFLIETNYGSLINSWRIEVRDDTGKEMWSGYGLGQPPLNAPWSGMVKGGKVIGPGVYSYRLIVRSVDGHEDWTPLQFFKIVPAASEESERDTIQPSEIGFTNFQREGKRSISLTAKPTVLVRGQAVPGCDIEVNGQRVTADQEGFFQKEIFVQPGKQNIQVKSTTPKGKTVSYQEEIDVKDTAFFMVGLGEEELGGNTFNGNLEAVGRDAQYHQGFYQKGRLAYYLKGKIKGRFLVTSRYDTTQNERQELFTNLDPDLYYPVYGDSSEINYDARDTQQKLFVLVEMDRSYVKWGSFNTKFDETELATMNRTLSGFKGHYEVVDTTKYGDSKRGITVFTAKANQLPDHNEFSGTGGSLYYLRNKDVVEGSEKLAVEVRDKLQGITVSKKDLVSKNDYEIDYQQGRIILRKPLSSVAYSDSVLDNFPLGGEEVYLVVDYEYEAEDLFGDQPSGVRGYTWMGDHVRVGGTAIKETRQDRDYDMRGVDVTFKLGNNTRVTTEYAQSKEGQTRNAVSYNGGITFSDIAAGDKKIKKDNRRLDTAWLVKAESKPFKTTDVTGYVQNFSRGFSNAQSISQKGDHKSGLEIRQKITDYFSAHYRFDTLKNRELANIPETSVHTAQLKYDDNRYLAVGEYRSENFDVQSVGFRGLEPFTRSLELKHGFGAKAGYRVNSTFLPYVKTQGTLRSRANNRIGAGVEAHLGERGTLRVEEMIGNAGDSTLLGFETKTPEGAQVYSRIQAGADDYGLGHGFGTTIGSSYNPNGRSRIYSEREVSSYDYGNRLANILGYDYTLSERWSVGVSGERSRIRDLNERGDFKDYLTDQADIYNVERTAGALEVAYADNQRLKWINRIEGRLDRGVVRRYQWLFAPSLDWKITDDYQFLARLNQSVTARTSEEGNLDADFTEFNIGLAYRPKNTNRMNALTRYTLLRNFGVPAQFDAPDHSGVEVGENSHIFGIEGTYDIIRWLGLAQKFGYKLGSLQSDAASGWISFGTFLSVSRLNFHVTRKWDIAAEYRIRMDHRASGALRHGFLFEVDREMFEYIRMGLGYNFTDFNDDLRYSNSYTQHGFFTRLSGKF